ncbi:hypothetical protein FPOAC1_009269 [Fusarium poae]|uniref:hypothetical protein n=1 Tax=Fusarium poae TaxID=36050 RepID=UPI001CE8BE1D|nr:hypothetical protein FPOAC1_009269 [Fusarium poae]KAG8669870.1 hypothetical protein FPOAC1_009269 [Fusarium poae]
MQSRIVTILGVMATIVICVMPARFESAAPKYPISIKLRSADGLAWTFKLPIYQDLTQNGAVTRESTS